MNSKKELKLAYGLLAACLFVGVLGYAVFPAKAPELPVRMMLKATGDDVLFAHQTHSDAYGLNCRDCHHTWQEADKKMPEACGECHTPGGKQKPALGKDGTFNHDAHSREYGLYCSDCHHNYQQGQEQPPQHCTACHQKGMGGGMMPGRKEAFHKQCIGCHENFGAGPARTECSACHSPRGRTDALHSQCMGCHEDFGAGPTKSDCSKCHAY